MNQNDFPILQKMIHGKPLVYLDNAATTQKPQQVINAIADYYTNFNANVHRGIHNLSERATFEFESSRKIIAEYIHAVHDYEVIFVRGTTEAINLVAHSFGRKNLKRGDEVLISEMEHHSNIVPWQLVCEEKGAKLKVIPISKEGELAFEQLDALLNEKTKLLALTYVSNALGTINPMREIIQMAHKRNIPVLVDGAQATSHLSINVQDLDCDFYAFSGHKLYGPTGIGILYGKEAWLESMPPYQGGGEMINKVTFAKTTYNSLPYKFEAGTPNIEGAIGLKAAIQYLQNIDSITVHQTEAKLLTYATDSLAQISGLNLIGTAKSKVSIISFVMDGIHPHDIGTILDREGIAIRAGHHCTQPLMDRLGITGTARASMAFYNTREEIDTLVSGLYKVKELLR